MDELVGESGDVIQSAHLAGRSKVLVIVYMRDACSALAFFDAQTGRRLADVTTDVLPESAAVSEVSSRPDSDDFYLKVETLISPPYIVVGRVVEGESEMTLARLLAADDEDQKLVCRREFYQSHDGVRVPMFICHAKNLRLEHGLRRPTLLHAYGGYSVSLQPFFDPFFVTFMRELGGVFAMACIRGGGEYGRAWHEAALGARRTVAFDDFVFAARHLQQTLTEPSLTASYGISNGGLLVSACMVRQPDAFGAVISEVGVLDLLRFHRFTLGRLWMGEFGNPDDARDREYLVRLSPLHNVQAGERYPHVLFTTADHDTRVVPSHSLKMLAELQSKAHGRSGRVLGRIYENAGHEGGSLWPLGACGGLH
ncbi:hypothetical protein L7F22_040111 [Adiantum nelumboides]|nr:hypothetical protein [Adiantum nelumboides]